MTQESTDVLAVGETMVLVAPSTAEPLATAGKFTLEIAGAESNTASHLVREGVPTGWAGAVGADPLGERILIELKRRGVDVSLATIDPAAQTGVFFKDVRSDATHVHYYRRDSAASRLGPDFADRLPLSSSKLIHLSGVTAALSQSSSALLDRILDVRQGAGLPVSFDVNYRPTLWADRASAAQRLLELSHRADIVFIGRDEAQVLWGTHQPREVSRLVSSRHLVVKDSSFGAYAYVDGVESFVRSPVVRVVDPVGAGDAFAAGYLSGWLGDESAAHNLMRGHIRAGRALRAIGDYADD